MAYKLIGNVPQVRRKLSGIAPVLDHLGTGAVEDDINEALAIAQADFEARTQVWLWPRVVLTYPGPTDVLGTNYDVQEDPLDFYTSSNTQASYFRLPHRPVASVARLAIEYSRTQSLITYPQNWIRLNHKMGVITIVPPIGGGLAGASVGSEYFLPLLRSGFRDAGPLMVSVDYTAGIQAADTDPEFAPVRECIAKLAAIVVRQNYAGLIANSAGRDGVSVSFDDNFDQIKLLTDQSAAYIDQFQQLYRPIRMEFI